MAKYRIIFHFIPIQICRCRATCIDHHNETYPEGSTWKPDVCTSCTCDLLGRLSCKETVCSVACSNPLPPKPGICCPVCHVNEVNKIFPPLLILIFI